MDRHVVSRSRVVSFSVIISDDNGKRWQIEIDNPAHDAQLVVERIEQDLHDMYDPWWPDNLLKVPLSPSVEVTVTSGTMNPTFAAGDNTVIYTVRRLDTEPETE